MKFLFLFLFLSGLAGLWGVLRRQRVRFSAWFRWEDFLSLCQLWFDFTVTYAVGPLTSRATGWPVGTKITPVIEDSSCRESDSHGCIFWSREVRRYVLSRICGFDSRRGFGQRHLSPKFHDQLNLINMTSMITIIREHQCLDIGKPISFMICFFRWRWKYLRLKR